MKSPHIVISDSKKKIGQQLCSKHYLDEYIQLLIGQFSLESGGFVKSVEIFKREGRVVLHHLVIELKFTLHYLDIKYEH